MFWTKTDSWQGSIRSVVDKLFVPSYLHPKCCYYDTISKKTTWTHIYSVFKLIRSRWRSRPIKSKIELGAPIWKALTFTYSEILYLNRRINETLIITIMAPNEQIVVGNRDNQLFLIVILNIIYGRARATRFIDQALSKKLEYHSKCLQCKSSMALNDNTFAMFHCFERPKNKKSWSFPSEIIPEIQKHQAFYRLWK